MIGEAQQRWAPLRRKYNLFLYRDSPPDPHAPQLTSGELPLPNTKEVRVVENGSQQGAGVFGQFAFVDEPFLSWDFSLLSADSQLIGSVNRNFAGFGREIFTDTGVYALRMDAAGLAEEPRHLISKTGETSPMVKTGMTLDQRAIMLATAVSVDFDYFSRKSGAGGMGFMPLWFPGGGGAAAEGAAAGEAGAAAEGGAGAAGAVGNAARGAGGVGEGAAVGAGSMAGYEAMHRGVYGDQSSQAGGQEPSQGFGAGQAPPTQPPPEQVDEVWGRDEDPWGGQGGSEGDSGGGGGGGDGGGGFDIDDWF